MFPSRHLSTLASGLSALFLLAGCSPAEKPATSSTTSAPAADTSYDLDFVEQSPGRPGGTLRVSLAADPLNLDNHVTFYGHNFGRLIADYLIYLNDKGEPTPYLAKSWDISPDGKTYTFHLRDDVTFSDGEKFNAEAVRVNLERIRNPATRAALSTALLTAYVDGKVIDDYTFQANLREPFSGFLQVVASAYIAMLSPKAIRENPKGLSEKPIGTGPFIVEKYSRNQGISFVKRPDYNWAPPLIKHTGPAYLDRVEIEFVPEPLIRQLTLSSGQYDLTLSAPPQNAPAIRADSTLVLKNYIMPGIPFRTPFFNVEKAPFDDIRVRKAFALAVDREGIAQIAGFGEYHAKSDFLADNARFYDPSFKDVLAYNPTEANRLLDEAGWATRDAEGFRTKDGKRLAATVLLAEPNIAIISVQSDVKKIGFEITIKQLPVIQRRALIEANDYQALGGGLAYNGNTPDVLFIRYHSSQINNGTFIGQNDSRLNDPEFDAAVEEGRHSLDPAVQKAAYSRAQKRLVELVPGVPLYEAHMAAAYKTYVKGVLHDTSSRNVSFTSIWFDQKPAQ